MFAEFGQAPLCLQIDLDTYDGLWIDVAGFRGREGWLRIVKGTIQSEHDILEADILVACDEACNPIPDWRAVHLTQCHWKGLKECEVAPPDVLDDLVCEAEGDFYARWQRETNADVAAEHLRTAARLEELEMQRHQALAGFAMEMQRLRRERLLSIVPEEREAITRDMAHLEYREEIWLEHYASRRRELVQQGQAREEALWNRTDVLIEFEPRFTIQWRAEAPILHSRRNLYEPRGERHYRTIRLPKSRARRLYRPEGPRVATPVVPRSAPVIQTPCAPIRLSPEAAQLLSNLAPLLAWKEGRLPDLPRWVDAATLEGCRAALVAENLRLSGREAEPGQAAVARQQVGRMLAAAEAAVQHWRDRATEIPEAETCGDDAPADENRAEAEEVAPDPCVKPEPEPEAPELAEQRAELRARLDRVERTLQAIKPSAPRREHYKKQAAALREELAQLATGSVPRREVDVGIGAPIPQPGRAPIPTSKPSLSDAPKPTYLHWTLERVALLTDMIEAGRPVSEIDQALGGVGAVRIRGKAHRLGLGASLKEKAETTPRLPEPPQQQAPAAPESECEAPDVLAARKRRETLMESRARVSSRIADLEALEAAHCPWTKPWFDVRDLLASARLQLEEVDRRLAEAPAPAPVQATQPTLPAVPAPSPAPAPAVAAPAVPSSGLTVWTPERLAQLRRLWGAGESAEAIAEALGGVSAHAVIGRAARMGLGQPGSAPKMADDKPEARWTAERVELLTRMWNAGHSAAEIGQALGGVSRNAVIGKAKRLRLQAGAQV